MTSPTGPRSPRSPLTDPHLFEEQIVAIEKISLSHSQSPEIITIVQENRTEVIQLETTTNDVMKKMLEKGSHDPVVESKRKLADFKRIFLSDDAKELTGHFNEFLKNIFFQLDDQKFGKLINEILSKKDINYEEVYKELFARIGEAKKGKLQTFIAQIKSLKVIKKTLSTQVKELLCKGAKVNGYLEYGYTGRLIRPLGKEGIVLSGKKFVVNDKTKYTDFVEAGGSRPYDTFIPMNDYPPLTDTIKEEASLELVNIPIGLHHIPTEKLDKFLEAIKKTVKPGGSLIVRDHDSKEGSDLDALVNVVHSVFNAATAIQWKDEEGEVRNFQDLKTWEELLKKHGFTLESKPLFTEGSPDINDPTRNGLLRFTNVPDKNSDVEQLSALETYMRMSKTGYERPALQTFMTSIEWHLVHIAKEYATFIQSNPVHKFPFFTHIGVIWKVFFDSCREAIREGGLGNTLKSEYMLMNFFMLVSSTIEFTFKGLAYFPLQLRCGGTNDPKTGTIKYLSDISEDYAEYIKETPFYDYAYFKKIGALWKTVNKGSAKNTLLEMYVAGLSTIDLITKGIISAPMSKMYSGQETGKMNLIVEDPDGKQVVDDTSKGIKVLKSYDEKFKAIEVPRYLKFKDQLKDLASKGVKIHSIAGQKLIQLKVKVPTTISDTDLIIDLKGCKALTDIKIVTDPTFKYKRLLVQVSELSNVIKHLDQNHLEIAYAHDF